MRLSIQETGLKKIPPLLGILVLSPLVALAPAQAAPPIPYASAFDTGLAPLPAPSASRWQQANTDVARHPRGHADILRWESTQSSPPGRTEGTTPAAGAPLTPAQALQQALQAQPDLLGRTRANELTQQLATERVRQLALDVERAWVEAVTAQQALGLQRQINDAARRGLELGQRMVQVGNWSQVPWLQQQASASATAVQLAQAQQAAYTSKERLIRLMGVTNAARVSLPDQLPALPQTALQIPDLEEQALQASLALSQAVISAQRASTGLADSDAQRWQAATRQAIDAATAHEASAAVLGRWPSTAPQLDTPRVVLSHEVAEAALAQAQARTLEANIRSQAREAYFRYRTALDVAQHRTGEGVRIATAQQEETQTRYNGMLQNTWDLLASARVRLQSLEAGAQAQRDFWLAHLDLQAVLAGLSVTFSNPSAGANATTGAPQGH